MSIIDKPSPVAYFKQMIKCPRNYVLKPGCQPFKVKPHPHLKNCSLVKGNEAREYDFAIGGQKIKLRNWVYIKDKFGNKIQDFNNYIQPEISAAEAIERIYDPLNPICSEQCKHRCLEGKEGFNWRQIKRLNDSKVNHGEIDA